MNVIAFTSEYRLLLAKFTVWSIIYGGFSRVFSFVLLIHVIHSHINTHTHKYSNTHAHSQLLSYTRTHTNTLSKRDTHTLTHIHIYIWSSCDFPVGQSTLARCIVAFITYLTMSNISRDVLLCNEWGQAEFLRESVCIHVAVYLYLCLCLCTFVSTFQFCGRVHVYVFWCFSAFSLGSRAFIMNVRQIKFATRSIATCISYRLPHFIGKVLAMSNTMWSYVNFSSTSIFLVHSSLKFRSTFGGTNVRRSRSENANSHHLSRATFRQKQIFFEQSMDKKSSPIEKPLWKTKSSEKLEEFKCTTCWKCWLWCSTKLPGIKFTRLYYIINCAIEIPWGFLSRLNIMKGNATKQNELDSLYDLQHLAQLNLLTLRNVYVELKLSDEKRKKNRIYLGVYLERPNWKNKLTNL